MDHPSHGPCRDPSLARPRKQQAPQMWESGRASTGSPAHSLRGKPPLEPLPRTARGSTVQELCRCRGRARCGAASAPCPRIMGSAARSRLRRASGRTRPAAVLELRPGVVVTAVFLFLTAAWGSPGDRPAPVPPGQHVTFTATAYCDTGTTKAGVRTRSGVAAADPRVLPVGSVVRLQSPEQPRYEGIYTVMDTGSAVQGRRIDLFISDCREAKAFGLRQVLVRVLRLGWNPQASAPSSSEP